MIAYLMLFPFLQFVIIWKYYLIYIFLILICSCILQVNSPVLHVLFPKIISINKLNISLQRNSVTLYIVSITHIKQIKRECTWNRCTSYMLVETVRIVHNYVKKIFIPYHQVVAPLLYYKRGCHKTQMFRGIPSTTELHHGLGYGNSCDHLGPRFKINICKKK